MTRHSILQKSTYSFNALPVWERTVLLILLILTLTSLFTPFFANAAGTDDVIAPCSTYVTTETYCGSASCEYCLYMKIKNGDYNSNSNIAETAAKWYCNSIDPSQWIDTANKYIKIQLNPDAAHENPDRAQVREDPFSFVWYQLSYYFPAIQAVGMLLLVLYLVLKLLEEATSDNITPEIFIKALCKLVIGYIIIKNLMPMSLADDPNDFILPQLLNAFSKLGVGADVSSHGISRAVLDTALQIADSNWAQGWGEIFSQMPAYILSLVLGLFVKANAYGRLIEIVILCVYSPIGVANLFNSTGGSHSDGLRYIKKIVAVALQGAIMYWVCLVTAQFIIVSSNNIEIIGNIAFMFAGCSLIGKSRRIATDIVNP